MTRAIGIAALAVCVWAWTSTSRAQDAPRVLSVSPEPGAVDVATTIPFVQVVFDRPMDRATYNGNIRLETADGEPAPACVFNGESQFQFVMCGQALLPGTTYTLSVTTGVLDALGQPLAEPFASTFTTAELAPDLDPPIIVSVNPPDGATGVSTTLMSVRVEFDEDMARESYSNNIILTDSTGARHSGCAGSSARFYDIVLCGSIFLPNETYTLHVTGVTDLAGNPVADFTSTFTTGPHVDDGLPPRVASMSPEINASGVSPTITQILVFFSEPMDRATYNNAVTLRDADGNRVSTCVHHGETFFGLILCGSILEPDAEYTVHVSSSVTDAMGNPLEADFTTSFRTAGPLDQLAQCQDDLALCIDQQDAIIETLDACFDEQTACESEIAHLASEAEEILEELAACVEHLSGTDQQLTAVTAQLTATQAQLTELQAHPALRDTDGDGAVDAGDHCPATPPGAAVDADGCSLPQFCATYAGNFAASLQCNAADWRNDGSANCTPRLVTLLPLSFSCVPR